MTYSDKLTQIQDLRRELRALEKAAEREARAMQPLTEADERRMQDLQVRADAAYVAANRKAPPPLAHERPDEYRRRLVAGVQGYSPLWRDVPVAKMNEDALEVAETQIYADAAVHGRVHGLRPKEIKAIEKNTEAGHRAIEYVGGPEAHFVRQFERPARRALFKSAEEYNAMMQTATMQQITNAYYRPTLQAPRAAF